MNATAPRPRRAVEFEQGETNTGVGTCSREEHTWAGLLSSMAFPACCNCWPCSLTHCWKRRRHGSARSSSATPKMIAKTRGTRLAASNLVQSAENLDRLDVQKNGSFYSSWIQNQGPS